LRTYSNSSSAARSISRSQKSQRSSAWPCPLAACEKGEWLSTNNSLPRSEYSGSQHKYIRIN
jgi:hypothetical protein